MLRRRLLLDFIQLCDRISGHLGNSCNLLLLSLLGRNRPEYLLLCLRFALLLFFLLSLLFSSGFGSCCCSSCLGTFLFLALQLFLPSFLSIPLSFRSSFSFCYPISFCLGSHVGGSFCSFLGLLLSYTLSLKFFICHLTGEPFLLGFLSR